MESAFLDPEKPSTWRVHMIARKTARISAGLLGLVSEGLLSTAYFIETTSRPAILFLMILIGVMMVILVARK
jgi:hypothetical protein